jgi:hypothetical protein
MYEEKLNRERASARIPENPKGFAGIREPRCAAAFYQ